MSRPHCQSLLFLFTQIFWFRRFRWFSLSLFPCRNISCMNHPIPLSVTATVGSDSYSSSLWKQQKMKNPAPKHSNTYVHYLHMHSGYIVYPSYRKLIWALHWYLALISQRTATEAALVHWHDKNERPRRGLSNIFDRTSYVRKALNKI